MDFRDYYVPAEHQVLRVKTLVFIEKYLENNSERFKSPKEFINNNIADSFVYHQRIEGAELVDIDEDLLIEANREELTSRINYLYGSFDSIQTLVRNPEMIANLLKDTPGLINEVTRIYNLSE